MAADLREMQENQWVSEIRIDKFRFVELIIPPQFGMVNYVTLKSMKGPSQKSAPKKEKNNGSRPLKRGGCRLNIRL